MDDAAKKALVVFGLLIVIGVAYTRACNASESAHPPATPAPPSPAAEEQHASWDTDVSRVGTGERDTARAVAHRLVEYCGSHDPHGDTWSGVQRITVEHRVILDGGKNVRVWELSADFPGTWKVEVLRGSTLWYRFDDDRVKIFPMKTVSGDVCGVPAEQWSTL